MNKNIGSTLVIIIIAYVVFFTGCVEEETTVSMETPTITTSSTPIPEQTNMSNPSLISVVPKTTKSTQSDNSVAIVRIGAIITDPDSYEGKDVILKGKYGGWGHCEGAKMGITGHPLAISDSAAVIFDETGCIYFEGVEWISKRPISDPYNPAYETIAIKGKVYLDKVGTPYIGRSNTEIHILDNSGGQDYASIQAAINAAKNGDTVVVAAGTYIENVVVNKSINLIGAGAGVTIVRGSNPHDHVFNVTINNVNISGFTVKRAKSEYDYYFAGIYLNGVKYATISNNAAMYNEYGIYLQASSNNTLTNNTASNNKLQGIHLNSSNNNMLSGNNASSNIWAGILLGHSSNNTLIGNNALDNQDGINIVQSSNYNVLNGNNATLNSYGIDMDSCNNNVLCDNIVSNNSGRGIHLYNSSNNTLCDNNVLYNGDCGMALHASTNNTLIGNKASSNKNQGIILLYGSNKNTLIGNNASDNNYGIYLISSSNNHIYSNYFNNRKNFYFDDPIHNNYWNITKTCNKKIIVDSYLSGNFWAYPNGTGFSQTCADEDRDGMCDSSYALDINNIDYLPLAHKPETFSNTIEMQTLSIPLNSSRL
ncbi:hypothetical protein DRO03_02210 [Methanosarcinales archaeon]|nr:MAG: hypothetical protein DRO03_02210 [Methanosarcinales archaeon]